MEDSHPAPKCDIKETFFNEVVLCRAPLQVRTPTQPWARKYLLPGRSWSVATTVPGGTVIGRNTASVSDNLFSSVPASSLPFPFPPLILPSLFFFPHFCHYLPCLRSNCPLEPVIRSGVALLALLGGLGQSPSRIRIWYILALKYDVGLQQL